MNTRWKRYLLYVSLIIVVGVLIYFLVETVRAKNTGFETKTLWDWMELLIIPLFLAGGAFFLNRSEHSVERARTEQRAILECELATDRQQEAILQSYLDRMGELLLEKKLRTRNTEVRNVARVRTLTVLRGLDGFRKRIVLKFLYEAGLIAENKTIVDLTDANLTGADLQVVDLQGLNLKDTNLKDANMQFANLQFANLRASILKDANLGGAYLEGANLEGANLEGAYLEGAYLESADLYAAQVTEEQLAKALSLQGATMPDGTIYG